MVLLQCQVKSAVWYLYSLWLITCNCAYSHMYTPKDWHFPKTCLCPTLMFCLRIIYRLASSKNYNEFPLFIPWLLMTVWSYPTQHIRLTRSALFAFSFFLTVYCNVHNRTIWCGLIKNGFPFDSGSSKAFFFFKWSVSLRVC